MSSLALYRRYRPESFAEVIGQEHVTDPLQQALRNNRVNHAYLFSGPRGCGKTTSARILARCLNCEQGPTPTPCGECQSCQDLARNGPGSIDVIEIDAASHGGVDDARDLREKAFFGPARSRYKIYIIDEAHMVTSAGFNALLKVVEEPPEHLKFIFATTEPEKVIGTIRSRTHHYPFRLVPPGTLRDYLSAVCEQEKIPVEDGVLPLVVRAGAGSVRDSMSVMDQLLAGAGDEGVTYAMATALLGYTDGSLLDSVVEAFASGDGAAAFEVVDRVIESGNDPRRFVADLLERLRDLVILSAVPDAAEKGLIDAPVDVVERMQAQARSFGAAELSRAADLVNQGLTEMRGTTSPRLQLELICARVLLPTAYGDERSVMARLDRIERGVQFSAGAGAPAMGYVPGPDAHAGAPRSVPPAADPPRPGGRARVRPTGGRRTGRGAPPARHGRRAGRRRRRARCRRPAPPLPRPPPCRAHGARARSRTRPTPAPPPGTCRRRAAAAAPRPAPGHAAAAGSGAGRRLAHGGARGRRTARDARLALRRGAGSPRRCRRAAGRRFRLPSRGQRSRPPLALAEHPGGGQEPPPVHLDPAQPERPGDRLRRHHAPARLRQRRCPGQLPEQRQRGRAAPGAGGAVQRPVEDRGGRRPLRRRLGTAALRRTRLRLPRRSRTGRRRTGRRRTGRRRQRLRRQRLRRWRRALARAAAGRVPGARARRVRPGSGLLPARRPGSRPLGAGAATRLARGRHSRGRRSRPRRVGPVRQGTDRAGAGRDGRGGDRARVAAHE
ncbi:DNA polymerase III subunit gamma and tau [Streptomyces leeuwenhoekii]|uniref:DNA polymerase III subunit gamma and tau n=1 Tax=Streptomyces leeuwenhoekii TaxID=1437453 RepID=UPI001F5D5049|nr:DNA polymerase III subunit gamma and tau [Streptomyces leeuwenhoekii]